MIILIVEPVVKTWLSTPKRIWLFLHQKKIFLSIKEKRKSKTEKFVCKRKDNTLRHAVQDTKTQRHQLKKTLRGLTHNSSNGTTSWLALTRGFWCAMMCTCHKWITYIVLIIYVCAPGPMHNNMVTYYTVTFSFYLSEPSHFECQCFQILQSLPNLHFISYKSIEPMDACTL